ncbi:MAG: 2-phospho-L-lactate guanylyltransferase [Actinomycetota bacterium]
MKPLADAKERLASVLSPDERRALSLAMLADVVTAARALDAVWVLNSDEDAADVALAGGAEPRPDPAPLQGLNPSLAAATDDAARAGATGVLILSADCPAASTEDVRALSVGRGVLLAPDRTGRGTNALWRSPPDVIPLAYGRDSKRAHMSLAHVMRVSFAIVPRAGIGLDIDRPSDLDAAWSAGVGDATRAVLTSLGYPSRRRG